MLPMDSSNTGVVTTGDVEAQQDNPNWFVNHKHMLRPNQGGEANTLGYFILRVPEYKRLKALKEFSPQGWRFGLHNRENLDNNESDALKLDFAVQYGLVGEKWDHFCDAIVDNPKAMLTCYGLRNGVTSWTDEQIKHVLALDALFLATYIDMKLNEQKLWKKFKFNANDVLDARFRSWKGIVSHDLRRVENQIPLVLIDKVVDYISNFVAFPTSEGNEPYIVDSQYQQRSVEFAVKELASCFMDTSKKAFKINNSISGGETHILGVAYKAICGSEDLLMTHSEERNAYIHVPLAAELKQFGIKIVHILGAAYKAICGSECLLMTQSEERNAYIHVPSATKLKQSGIKIVGVDEPLCRMSYKKKCLRLHLPKMRIYDDTISFIRNMAWYEWKIIPGGCLFNDYVSLMSDLIQAPEDLELLKKVIDNKCGIKGFEMWTALKEGSVEVDSSLTHHQQKEAIKSRCERRRPRLWSEFKMVFCSKPWLVLSTIAVVLVTMATLVQTYTAIIGSNKMKPKFP